MNIMQDLTGKITLITGASAGIGAACAEIFAKQGAHLLLTARRHDKLQQLSQDLQQRYHTSVDYAVLDVTNPQNVQDVLKDYPKIDIVINNAGLALGLDPVESAAIADWDNMIDTNIKGLLYVTQQIIPKMKAHNHGHIINISSTSAHRVYPGGSVYCATKHAVDAITRGLKLELADTPIRVTALEPGLTETEFSLVRFQHDANRARQVYANMTPLTAEDIAEAVLFCVTRKAHININSLQITPVDQKGLG
ncbi:MAG: SDR family NAD(P)-dependent oxidoreductase [Legionellales bacterium]|nr:SDR family NAD(P)-dependent oxidoreductase [Legionellales bacterium]